MIKTTQKKDTVNGRKVFALMAILLVGLFLFYEISLVLAAPEGPSSINVTANRTKTATAAQMINVTGGNITAINLTAVIQDVKWKAFVGWIDGRFTLDDAGGQTIYDWTLSSITGEVYATRQSGSVTWGSIVCANTTTMEAENTALAHSSAQDNITATFSRAALANHSAFVVSGTTISANSCNGTLNTYVSDASQNTDFEEVVLYDSANIVYATILESDATGYDGSTYDFQMLVPDNGSATWTSKIAYYLYVELN